MTYCIRLEGTLTEGADPDIGAYGTLRPGAIEKCKALIESGARIVIVSAVIKYPQHYNLLYRWLVREGLDFTDVWAGYGLPAADVFIDDLAVSLKSV